MDSPLVLLVDVRECVPTCPWGAKNYFKSNSRQKLGKNDVQHDKKNIFISYLMDSPQSLLSTSVRESNMSLRCLKSNTRLKWCMTWRRKKNPSTTSWTPPSPRCRRPWGSLTCPWGDWNHFKLISRLKLGWNDVRHEEQKKSINYIMDSPLSSLSTSLRESNMSLRCLKSF